MAEFTVGFTQGVTLDNILGLPDLTWDEIQTEALPTVAISGNPSFDLLLIGKLYRTSDKISGITRHVGDVRELPDVPLAKEDITSGEDTLTIVERYFSLGEKPVKIVGAIIRTLE